MSLILHSSFTHYIVLVFSSPNNYEDSDLQLVTDISFLELKCNCLFFLIKKITDAYSSPGVMEMKKKQKKNKQIFRGWIIADLFASDKRFDFFILNLYQGNLDMWCCIFWITINFLNVMKKLNKSCFLLPLVAFCFKFMGRN